ncbi:dihydrolipoyl dehydrogenase family protein [Halomarina halobia]|uniref:Dihydrolipoyl dehydrogenase family protein n=1 Tax=Halomarina halobia TaxID=3033386 RepID=A0ABD6A661_9EURY|nr:dihydrolipoyl dehydrogenase [Halomarina sp. PSR21]
MADFDVLVIGGGTGNEVANAAADAGLETALIERGPIGGTCVNRGCNPSKTLIQRADLVESIRRAGEFGVDVRIEGVDYEAIVREVTASVDGKSDRMERTDRERERLTLFREQARFVDDRTLEIGGREVTGEKVVVAAGARPIVPPIEGIDEVDYLTNREALRLETQPERLVVIGGGYIAAELGHFYEALGTDVTIVGRDDVLVGREDREVADAFTDLARRRHTVHTGYTATAVERTGAGIIVYAERNDGGEEIEVDGDDLLVAAGRRPNTDLLDVEAAGIETDERGFVETNEYLETSAPNVWAQGDIAGNYQFKHAADHEAKYVVENALRGEQTPVDYTGMAHAIFTSPQIAATGLTERELEERDRAYVVGRRAYGDTVMGRALKEEDGFVKVLADPDDGTVLGCHIVGPEASTLIHEVIVAITSGSGTVSDVTNAIHVHPALSKVVLGAFEDADA